MPSDSGGKPSSTVPPASFPEVYRAHFRFVWRALARLGIREADLLDATQNVFVVVHRQLGGFEGRSELTTWLFSICRRVAKDYLRSAPVRHEVLVDVNELSGHAECPENPLRRLESGDLERVLQAVLGKLPEKLRTAFVLFELEEMSGEDIGHLLGVPVGTIRSRLRLAREAFQREVKLLSGVEDGASLGVPLGESLGPSLPRMGRA